MKNGRVGRPTNLRAGVPVGAFAPAIAGFAVGRTATDEIVGKRRHVSGYGLVETGATGQAAARHRVLKIASWLIGLVLLLVILDLAGVDVRGWLVDLRETVTEISWWYVVLGCIFQGCRRR